MLPKASIIFDIFMNIAMYMIYTLFCFYMARPPTTLIRAANPRIGESKALKRAPNFLRRAVTLKQMSKVQTIAVCFCGAAKTTSLGIPLSTAMWIHADNLTRAYIQIPVLLYTIEQVFLAQILVYFFKWYLRKDLKKEEGEEQQADLEDGRTSFERRDAGPALATPETKEVQI